MEDKKNYAENLGSKTWGFLHEFAKGFGNIDRRNSVKIYKMIHGMADVYPCARCRKHFRQFVQKHKPYFKNGQMMRQYFCKFHNSVNELAGKPTYNCANL